MITPEAYYSSDINYGGYQYITLKDIVNQFMINFTGDTTVIGNIKRHNVIYHAKRGIQELNFDVLRNAKVLELEIDDTYQLVLPFDYINYIRISWLDDLNRFHPMSINNNSSLASAYLQDNDYNILFDSDGYPLSGDSIQSSQINNEVSTASKFNDVDGNYNGLTAPYKRYDNDTTINSNGTFNIDKRRGIIQFSTDIGSKIIILEYVSDGLNSNDEGAISIHKQAVSAIMAYIKWMILSNKFNVQEYIVRRTKKEWYNARRLAKSRLSGVRLNELALLLNAKGAWVKH